MTLAAKNALDTAGSTSVASNLPTTTGTTQAFIVDVSGSRSFTVLWRLKATVTPGDLTLAVVQPVYPDGVTIVAATLPAATSVAPAAAGADVCALATYDTRGLTFVNITAKNNNAGTKNLDIVVVQVA